MTAVECCTTSLNHVFICSSGLSYTGNPLTAALDALTNEFAVHQMSGIGGGILRDLFAVSANSPVRIPS